MSRDQATHGRLNACGHTRLLVLIHCQRQSLPFFQSVAVNYTSQRADKTANKMLIAADIMHKVQSVFTSAGSFIDLLLKM